MHERTATLLRDPRVLGAGDAALAFALAVLSVVPVLLGDLSWGHPVPLALALAVVSTVPVAWRGRAPLSAATVVLLANGLCVFAAAPADAAFQPFVALVLVSYSVGSRCEGRRARYGPPVLAAAAIPLFVGIALHGQSIDNIIPSYLWMVTAWVVGRVVRGWRLRTVELERANRELAEQRELQAQAAVILERGRIARELHDVIAHNVSMMAVQAGAAGRVLDGDQPDVRNALDVIADTGRQTVDEMRTLLGILRAQDATASLSPQPGLADLDRLVHGMREAGLPVGLRIEGEPRPLPRALDLSAYRIVQDALTNTLRHAGPAQADVTLAYRDGFVELRIADTGRTHATAARAGHGLLGMRERVAMLGGELMAAPAEDGFVVRAMLPLAPA